MTASAILLSVEDGVATITLNRPEQLNTLTPEMTELLTEYTARVGEDDAVRCVVLRGAGKAFMAGGDVKGLHEALGVDRAAHVARMEMRVIRGHQFVSQLRRMPKPVIAAVHNAVAGFGVGLSMAADIIIARDDTFFLLAYRHIGLTADGGVTHFLPRMIGERKALELSLLGERLPANEALAAGMVNWVVEPARFDSFVAEIAARLANGPTRALGRVKELIRTSLDHSWHEQSHLEAESIRFASATDDHYEGVTAFVEKRAASFKGL